MRKTALLFAILFAGSHAQATPITGHVRFIGRPPGVAVPTIIYAEALDGGRVQPAQFKMEQKNKTFVPHVLAIPAGSTVAFPNDDLIFHNVFSLSRPNPFDLGLYRAGTSQNRTFTTPAVYHVFCNIHPQMSAIILVVPAAHITEAGTDGNYRLELPAGRYRVTAWSERAEPSSVEITAGNTPVNAPDVSLDESKFVEMLHKNKFGQDYPKSAYDVKK